MEPEQGLENAQELAASYSRTAEEAKLRVRMSDTEYDQLVKAVVRHVVFRQHQKPGEPIARAELTDVVGKATTKKNVSSAVLPAAQSQLASVFGLHLKEVAKRARGQHGQAPAADASSGAKVFLVRSLVPQGLRKEVLVDAGAAPAQALTMLILGLVRVAGGKLSEDELWRLLEELGVSKEEPHPEFGDVKSHLAAFVKQRYLIESKVQGPEGEMRELEWGEQAEQEFPNNTMNDWTKKVVGNTAGRGEAACA